MNNMPTYKIGDKEYLLEEISCIDKPYGYDANTIRSYIWLKGGEKTCCSIHAIGEERNPDSTGGTNGTFVNRAYSQFDEFIAAWRTVQQMKYNA